MTRVRSVSTLICTYNRASFLRESLEAILAAVRPPGVALDVIVVDNRSTDATRQVVDDVAARAPVPVRYALETQQGKSFALNRGLDLAAGDVIALTDDDVVVDRNWIVRLVEGFERHDVTFVGGKVLPRWGTLPPPELLTRRGRDMWGPLALVDYGDDPVTYDEETFAWRQLPIGANLAVKADAVRAVGGWRTDLGKVNNTLISGEDHEIFFRLSRAGLFNGLYDPDSIVFHHVPPGRLTRRYFRRWFFWHGRTLARMNSAIHPDLDWSRVRHVAGVPRYMYRSLLTQTLRWLRRLGRRDALALLIEEMRLIEHLGYFAECWQPGGRAAIPAGSGRPPLVREQAPA
ncbi:MAG TPA: glycosyltransferase [Vicinamibacterales bacterium]|nr:glycosyltransferase [Vicinamibacterales bacterium]